MSERARRLTPRPTFSGPTVLRRDEVAHHVWGDAGSSLVTDRVDLSNDQLHVLEFELPPRSEFRHSESNKTVFAADVAYCVLAGELIVADPEFGEVQMVPAGSTVFFRRDSWHHGFNPGGDVVRVVEFFAPLPARGAASEYARRQPDLQRPKYRDDRWNGRLPDETGERQSRLRVIEARDAHWSFAAVGTVSSGRHAGGHRVPHRRGRPRLRRPCRGPAADRRRVSPRRHGRRAVGRPVRCARGRLPVCAASCRRRRLCKPRIRGSSPQPISRPSRGTSLGSGHVPDGWRP